MNNSYIQMLRMQLLKILEKEPEDRTIADLKLLIFIEDKLQEQGIDPIENEVGHKSLKKQIESVEKLDQEYREQAGETNFALHKMFRERNFNIDECFLTLDFTLKYKTYEDDTISELKDKNIYVSDNISKTVESFLIAFQVCFYAYIEFCNTKHGMKLPYENTFKYSKLLNPKSMTEVENAVYNKLIHYKMLSDEELEQIENIGIKIVK